MSFFGVPGLNQRRIIFGLVLAAGLLAGARAQAPHTHEHSFSGAQHWAEIFDDPARDAWQKPHEVIEALGLAPNTKVVDIGAGTGYFTVRIAHMFPATRVYAEDIEPEMIRYVSERAQREKLTNVVAVLGKPDDPLLPEAVDLALVVDTYHHIGDRVAYFRRLKQHLSTAGEVAIIDFTTASSMGPPVQERIPPAAVKGEMAQAGYTLATEHTFLPDQYFLVFRATR